MFVLTDVFRGHKKSVESALEKEQLTWGAEGAVMGKLQRINDI